jgi:antitoxin component of RelBE/YafQ-DinJ toxin-antitoxin module
MVTHMKTTVEISDALLEEAKKVASREGATVRELIEQGLRQVISQRKQGRPFRLRKATFKGQGLSREAKELGWDRLRELAYEGRGG